MLNSYQLLDQYDMKTFERAETHSKKVNKFLQKMKNDLVRAHVQSIKIENAKKEVKKYGIEVETIPERARDDPMGVLDTSSIQDSLQLTQNSGESKLNTRRKKKNEQGLKLNTKAVSKFVKSRDIVGPKGFMVEKHEKFINQEAKIAEEEMNDPKKKKNYQYSQRSSMRSSRGSVANNDPGPLKTQRSSRGSVFSQKKM